MISRLVPLQFPLPQALLRQGLLQGPPQGLFQGLPQVLLQGPL